MKFRYLDGIQLTGKKRGMVTHINLGKLSPQIENYRKNANGDFKNYR